MHYYLLTLGCPKNVADSEALDDALQRAGHLPVTSPQAAEVMVVNTCAFIEAAKQESLEALLSLAAAKAKGQRLIAAGCLAQRYPAELRQGIPQVDQVVGVDHWRILPQALGQTTAAGMGLAPRRPSPSRYLKIADGCNAACSFCVIPTLKGPHRSKPRAQILAEAQRLVQEGAKEIVLVAQDTTAYGQDLGEKDALAALVAELGSRLPQDIWLRIMYAHPAHISHRLLEAMAQHPQVCHYLDLPLQHAHPKVLRRMGRPSDLDRVRQLIASLREVLPDLALRTAFIVGFPGETEEEFQALLSFVAEGHFDHVGVFTYSRERGTRAATLPRQVPERVKRARFRRVMEAQQEVSWRRNLSLVGRELAVLVEGHADHLPSELGGTLEGPLAVGRSYRQAPEIDGQVWVQGTFPVGEIVQVRVTAAWPYDLLAQPVG
jgi:ribosomal protein S12 methylthiotransferase